MNCDRTAQSIREGVIHTQCVEGIEKILSDYVSSIVIADEELPDMLDCNAGILPGKFLLCSLRRNGGYSIIRFSRKSITEKENIDIQKRGAEARRVGSYKMDNPYLKSDHLPAGTGESLEVWQAKHTAWELGWTIQDRMIN